MVTGAVASCLKEIGLSVASPWSVCEAFKFKANPEAIWNLKFMRKIPANQFGCENPLSNENVQGLRAKLPIDTAPAYTLFRLN